MIIFTAVLLAFGSVFDFAFGANGFNSNSTLFVLDALFSLVFPVSVLVYFFAYKRYSVRDVVSQLGLIPSRRTPVHILIGVGIFLLMLAIEIATAAISNFTNVQINTNVSTMLNSAPMWFLIFSAVIVPLNEEILFRGFLVPRIGIFFSAVVFGLGHYAYNSTFGIEIIAAFIFGLIAGYAFKRTKSLYPSLIAHILVNATTLAALTLLVVR